jgi:hypothetical protein
MITATQDDYAREIAKLVATMPVERAAQVYDFARFLKSASADTPSPISEEDDWLNDSPQQIADEDMAWDAAFARNRHKIRTVAKEAIEDYRTGRTEQISGPDGWVPVSAILKGVKPRKWD